jgi:hypothetical protein
MSGRTMFVAVMVAVLGYCFGGQQGRGGDHGGPQKPWCFVQEGTLPDPCQPCSDYDCPPCVDGVCYGNHKVCAGTNLPDYVLKQEDGFATVTVTSIPCYCIWNCAPREPNDPCGPDNPCEPVDGSQQCSETTKPGKTPSGDCPLGQP